MSLNSVRTFEMIKFLLVSKGERRKVSLIKFLLVSKGSEQCQAYRRAWQSRVCATGRHSCRAGQPGTRRRNFWFAGRWRGRGRTGPRTLTARGLPHTRAGVAPTRRAHSRWLRGGAACPRSPTRSRERGGHTAPAKEKRFSNVDYFKRSLKTSLFY